MSEDMENMSINTQAIAASNGVYQHIVEEEEDSKIPS